MKKMLFFVFGLLIMVTLSGCTGSSGSSTETKAKKVINEQTDEESAPELFKMGDSIQLGDYVMSVSAIEDYTATNEFMLPEEGNKLVAVEVSYENNTTDKSINYNPYDWKLFDQEGYSFETGFVESKEPSLSSGALNPGGKVKGWITFEVPEGSEKFKIQFTPDFWSNDNIEVQLY